MNSEINKLLLITISDQFKKEVVEAFAQAGLSCTDIGTSSGWFTSGFSTLLVVTPASRLQEARDLLENICVPSPDPNEKHAIVYVLPVDEAGELQAEAA
ncbi:MAG: hypothetical protein Fur0018_07850 [Anaerolineales bacterium]